MGFSARATTKGAARTRRRRPCTPPRSSSTLPAPLGVVLRSNKNRQIESARALVEQLVPGVFLDDEFVIAS